MDQICIHEDIEPSPWSMCCFVSGMFTVDVHPQVHAFAPQFQHVSRDRLFYVAIKLNPLALLKAVLVYLNTIQIKRQPRFVILPRVQENMEDRFQMSLPRQLQMRIQHQNLRVDVYFTEFDHPPEYTNNRLVVRIQLWVRLVCHLVVVSYTIGNGFTAVFGIFQGYPSLYFTYVSTLFNDSCTYLYGLNNYSMTPLRSSINSTLAPR